MIRCNLAYIGFPQVPDQVNVSLIQDFQHKHPNITIVLTRSNEYFQFF